MDDDWPGTLEEYVAVFERLVRPHAESMLRAPLEIVETPETEGVRRVLDRDTGIDLLLVKAHGTRGVGLRQQCDRNWRTFSVRFWRKTEAETEYAKRLRAMEHGYLYPQLTMQAFVTPDKDRLLSVGIAKTCDVWAMIARGHCGQETREDGTAAFYYVKWDCMRGQPCWLLEWPYPSSAGEVVVCHAHDSARSIPMSGCTARS